jgi:hypothetical protein
MHAQPVINQRASVHWYGARCENFEMQEGWRKNLQVMGVGEEIKDLCSRTGQPKFGFKNKDVHFSAEYAA